MANPTLKADKREILGRKVKKLRREGILPANVYGKKVKSQALQASVAEFKKVFTQVGETGLVDLKVNGDTRPVLIHNVQLDSVTDEPLHADFLQVDLKEKVTATVPLEFVGESPAEKTEEGIVVHQMNEIEVEALPMDLPDQINVDVSGLAQVDDAIKVADLNIDWTKVEVKGPERIVVNVAPPAKEEEVVPPPAEEEAPLEEAAPAEEEEAPEEEKAPKGEKEVKPEEAAKEREEKFTKERPKGGEQAKEGEKQQAPEGKKAQ